MFVIPFSGLFLILAILCIWKKKYGGGGVLIFFALGFALEPTEVGQSILRSLASGNATLAQMSPQGGNLALHLSGIMFFAALLGLCFYFKSVGLIACFLALFFGLYTSPSAFGPPIERGVVGTNNLVNNLAPAAPNATPTATPRHTHRHVQAG